jgi:hypothetical protein
MREEDKHSNIQYELISINSTYLLIFITQLLFLRRLSLL